MTEAQFQAKVTAFLREQDIYFIKYWGGGRFTKAGVPDILCCVGGRFVAVELKTDSGKATPLQLFNLDRIRESGGQAFLLRPEGFETFKRIIREVKRCNTATVESAPSSNVGADSSSSTSKGSEQSRTRRPTTL